jgi:serine/threonine protein kinase
MIDIHNQAILMDFGIVKILGGEKHTATGAVVGTALYLPPESIRGEVPDPRSDQYSLAVTLFEAISGRPPYEADSAMTLMMMHLNDPAPDIRQLRPDVPPDLGMVIEKALSKSREDRFSSMADFAAALHSALSKPAPVEQAATLADPAGSTAQDTLKTGPGEIQQLPALLVSPAAPPSESTWKLPDPANQSPAASLAAPAASPDSAAASAPAAQPQPKPALWAGLAGATILIIIAAAFLLRNLGNAGQPPAAPLPTSAPTETQAAQAIAPLVEASPTPTTTITPTLPPPSTPTITPSPTATIPVGVPYARINSISLNSNGYYVVDYETFEYTEKVPGQHVHFFFNTVTQDQAGSPGKGPWKLYGGPRPFDQYRTVERPEAATQMCILVANPDHSIRPDSGNCVILPDIPVAAPVFADACLSGPGSDYPLLGQLQPGHPLLVLGISADEAWWVVAHPTDPDQSCWLQRSRSDFSGDITSLPMAEAPSDPASNPTSLAVQINQISLDGQGRYVVEFSTAGFTPALPGTHIHFYFDIYAADQARSGNRLMYGGDSPFTGYTQANRPQGAAQLCALVANPNHTIIPDSGNCFTLP